jgi:hypothetical protein
LRNSKSRLARLGQIYHAYADAAEQMLEEDVKANKALLQLAS